MSVNVSGKNYVDENRRIELSKQIDNRKIIMNVSIMSEKFVDYQKNLFTEFFSNISDGMEKMETFREYKSFFEASLEDFNTNLRSFQEKLSKNKERYEIRGSIHLVWDEQYISSLIGESSIVIFRNGKLLSVIANEVYDDDKIDIFSEMVEGEVESQDKILAVACNVYDYLGDEEIEEIIGAENIIDKLEEILSVKISNTEIVSAFLLEIHFKTIKVESKLNPNALDDAFGNLKKIAKKNRYPLSIGIGILLIGIIIIGVFKSLGKSETPVQELTTPEGEVVTIDMEDVKREIDNFDKISADSPTKKEKYNEIMTKLETLENNDIQSLDVSELKNKMQASYYKGFNVKFVSKQDGLLENLYSFSDDQISNLGNVKGFARTNKIHVYGDKGTLLYIINQNQKPIQQEFKLGTIETCNTDLYEDGLYCVSSTGDLHRFYKEGMKQITNAAGKWPSSIKNIGKYKSSNIYTFTSDSSSEVNDVYITKYVNTSQGIKFGEPTYYTFSNETTDDMKQAVKNGTYMAVDGTFLVWSKEKGLLQLYRPTTSNEINVREVTGWEPAKIQDGDLLGDVKVIASDASTYVYLYDEDTESVIAYNTSPFKNNTSYTYNYKLKYKFKVKLNLNGETVKDIDVKFGSEHTLYILTDKGVYKMSMKEFMAE